MTGRARRLLVVGVTAVLVAGCSGSGAGSESGSGSSGDQAAAGASGGLADGGVAVAEVPGAATDAAAGVDAAGVDAAGVDAVQEGRLVVSTGSIAVVVEDVADAGRRVTASAEAAGGLVTASGTGATGTGATGSVDPAAVPEVSEDDQDSQASPEQAHYTLRVPGPAFEQVLGTVGELGRVTDRSTSATDVTAEVADVGSRVASAQAVLTTFRDRLPQASTIPDILALEGEIARRQADLEALQARQRVLGDQVALATLEVTLTAADPADTVAADAPGGFLGGLSTGWAALAVFLRGAAVVLGVVLPFALPATVVAGVVVLVRRRRGADPTAGADA